MGSSWDCFCIALHQHLRQLSKDATMAAAAASFLAQRWVIHRNKNDLPTYSKKKKALAIFVDINICFFFSFDCLPNKNHA